MRLFVTRLCNVLSVIAGAVLIVMACLTFADVVMRYLGRPIVGVYEVVAYLGVAVTGFALPRASLMKAQVYVDIVIDKLPGGPRRTLKILTRLLVVAMFLILAVYFVIMGKNLIANKAVTLSLRLPYYPVVFGMAVSCIAQCLVSLYQIGGENGGSHE